MHMSDLVTLDALDLSARIRARDASCVEVMEAFLDHIDHLNPRVNAIVALRERSDLLAEAKARDAMLDRGEYLGWMHGLPHAVKDLAAVEGLPWTEGSTVHRDRVAETDELFVRRLKAAGAIIVGKTNTPEFGLGSHTYNEVWGTTTNPYDTARSAGGSSGGAAAALALRMLPVADGSDYLGSLRNPAAFNNVLGMRPTWGRVPVPGFVSHPAVVGPMGRTVADVAALLSVLAGPDSSAPLGSATDPAVYTGPLGHDFGGTRIAWAGDWGGHLATEPGLLAVCESAFAALESLGCRVEPAVPAYPPEEIWQTLLTWRGFAQLARRDLYDDPAAREQLKPEAVWEIENAVALSALDLARAEESRIRWYDTVMGLFEAYDFVLAPSAQVFPFDAALPWPHRVGDQEMDSYHRWMETVAPWSLTNLPVMGMPAGFDERGLPTGLQLVGPYNGDLSVLQLAHAYEQVTDWVHRAPPPMLGPA
jgi:ureidomalonase